jgi:hypothetical protein
VNDALELPELDALDDIEDDIELLADIDFVAELLGVYVFVQVSTRVAVEVCEDSVLGDVETVDDAESVCCGEVD